MSEIDSYKHECIGMVHCPSSYWSPETDGQSNRDPQNVYVPLYLLEQDALDAASFQAKSGDLLLGGGRGESSAMRISMPEALVFFTREDWDKYFLSTGFFTVAELNEKLFHAYWSMSEAFRFGDGYAKLGWNPNDMEIEIWLVQQILAFVLREYPGRWADMRGAVDLVEDGSICRLPTEKEKAVL